MNRENIIQIGMVVLVLFLLILGINSVSTSEQVAGQNITYEISHYIMPKIDNNTYIGDIYDCSNFSEKAKGYFESLGYNVSIVQRDTNKTRGNVTIIHAFIRINEPVYIEPQIRKIINNNRTIL
ncbi:MAG: hypothetical protein JRI44_14070 [Deltaproteobacteria bacterium]|nr:hypothetical protein [Deltaproteobacteria bacterium]